MADSTESYDPLDLWQRRLSPVTPWLMLSGDLHHLRHRAEAQIETWRAAGITTVIDVREEWNDEDLVAELAPDLGYWHLGTHDDGVRQADAWFDSGLEAYREAIAAAARQPSRAGGTSLRWPAGWTPTGSTSTR